MGIRQIEIILEPESFFVDEDQVKRLGINREGLYIVREMDLGMKFTQIDGPGKGRSLIIDLDKTHER